jgi:hypothetical protein
MGPLERQNAEEEKQQKKLAPPSRFASVNVGLGPLNADTQGFLHGIRLHALPLAPNILRQGEVGIDFAFDWSNTFSVKRTDIYTLDYETLRFLFAAEYGITDAFRVGLALPVARRGGGVLDSFVEDFHSTFGLNDTDRKGVAKNQHRIRYHTTDGGTVDIGESGETLNVEDLVLSARYQWAIEEAILPAIALAAAVGLPTGPRADLLGSGHPGVAADLAISKGFFAHDDPRDGRWIYAYAGVEIAYYGPETVGGLDLTQAEFALFGALEIHFVPRVSAIGQVLMISGSTHDLPNFDRPTFELAVGFKGEVVENMLAVEIGVVENIINLDPSADVTFHLGVRLVF